MCYSCEVSCSLRRSQLYVGGNYIGGVFGAVGFLAIVVIIIVVIWKRRCAYINR